MYFSTVGSERVGIFILTLHVCECHSNGKIFGIASAMSAKADYDVSKARRRMAAKAHECHVFQFKSRLVKRCAQNLYENTASVGRGLLIIIDKSNL